MSLSPQELLAEYRIAFRNANPRTKIPTIEYSHGWFRFTDWGSGRNFRRPAFVGLIDNLRLRTNEATAAALSSQVRQTQGE